MLDWVLDCALMRWDPCTKHEPDVDFLVRLQPSQLEALGAVNAVSLSCHLKPCTSLGPEMKYRPIRFKAAHAPLTGRDINREHYLHAYIRSGRSMDKKLHLATTAL